MAQRDMEIAEQRPFLGISRLS